MKANVDYTLCLVYKRQFEKDGTCTKYTLGQEFKIKILKTLLTFYFQTIQKWQNIHYKVLLTSTPLLSEYVNSIKICCDQIKVR